MNKEIKFRLHDKEGNIIGYEVHEKNQHGCYQILQYTLRGDWEEQVPKNVRDGYFIAATHKCQFTGMNDFNKKEIYDGDILEVEINGANGKEKTVWTVEYKSFLTNIGFMVYGKNRRFNRLLTFSVIINSKAKVIGNIHG